ASSAALRYRSRVPPVFHSKWSRTWPPGESDGTSVCRFRAAHDLSVFRLRLARTSRRRELSLSESALEQLPGYLGLSEWPADQPPTAPCAVRTFGRPGRSVSRRGGGIGLNRARQSRAELPAWRASRRALSGRPQRLPRFCFVVFRL